MGRAKWATREVPKGLLWSPYHKWILMNIGGQRFNFVREKKTHFDFLGIQKSCLQVTWSCECMHWIHKLFRIDYLLRWTFTKIQHQKKKPYTIVANKFTKKVGKWSIFYEALHLVTTNYSLMENNINHVYLHGPCLLPIWKKSFKYYNESWILHQLLLIDPTN